MERIAVQKHIGGVTAVQTLALAPPSEEAAGWLPHWEPVCAD